MAQALVTLLVHVVFSTKNRADLIALEIETELYSYVGGVLKGRGEFDPFQGRIGLSRYPVALPPAIEFVAFGDRSKLVVCAHGWGEGVVQTVSLRGAPTINMNKKETWH